MRCIFVLVMILTTPIFANAGDRDALQNLLQGYAEHSQRLQNIRATRPNGSSYRNEQMIELKKDLLMAIKAIDDYRTQLLRAKEPLATHEVPLALKYIYLAMFQVIALELDYDLYKSKLALMLSEKYVDIWRSVDASIPRPASSS